MIQLRFTNQTNIGDAYYEGGWVQVLYLEADLQRPVYEITREVTQGATGERLQSRATWTKSYEFVAGVVPEYMLNALYFASAHQTVQVVTPLGKLVTVDRMDVTAVQQDDCYFMVTLKMLVDSVYF